MQVVLAMFRADGERRSFSIFRDMTVIGRREDCDLRIPLGEVSRKHCRIIKDGDTIRLEDLGSSNGTFHNNERVQEATISPGDAIRVGPVTFVVQIDGVPSDEDLVPPQTDGTTASDIEVAESSPDAAPMEEEASVAEPSEDVAPTSPDAVETEPVAQDDFNVQIDSEEAAPTDDVIEFEPDNTSHDQPA